METPRLSNIELFKALYVAHANYARSFHNTPLDDTYTYEKGCAYAEFMGEYGFYYHIAKRRGLLKVYARYRRTHALCVKKA
jgi:hypothetical protein